MLSRDKRASLSSKLLAAKEDAGAADADERTASDRLVDRLASRHGVPRSAVDELRESAKSEATARATVLYTKGDASASGFRPFYWSYERDGSPQPRDNTGTVTPFPASAPAATIPPGPVSAPATSRFGKTTLIALAASAFSAVALIASATLFMLSRSPDTSEPRQIAAAVQPAEPAFVPPPKPTETRRADAQPAEIKSAEPKPADTKSLEVKPVEVKSVEAKAAETIPAEARAEFKAEESAVATSPPRSLLPPPKPVAELPAPTPALAEPPHVVATLSPQEVADLMARGDQLLNTGDIVAARVFFERAAEQGNAVAATAVGKTFDPLFLEEAHVRGIRGDPVMAAKWYRMGSAGGDQQADIRMKKLIAKYAG
jgi:hypothetical protein